MYPSIIFLCILYALFPNTSEYVHEIEFNILESKTYVQYMHKI